MNWHKTYLDIANVIAQHSKDPDRKVGCVVVKDNSIISFGYNGTPHGFDNNCKDENGKTKPEVIHAESNAITKCAKSTISIAGASMYSTLACCAECAKLIIQCDIKEFYYTEAWKDPTGINLLIQAGIKVVHMFELIKDENGAYTGMTFLRTQPLTDTERETIRKLYTCLDSSKMKMALTQE